MTEPLFPQFSAKAEIAKRSPRHCRNIRAKAILARAMPYCQENTKHCPAIDANPFPNSLSLFLFIPIIQAICLSSPLPNLYTRRKHRSHSLTSNRPRAVSLKSVKTFTTNKGRGEGERGGNMQVNSGRATQGAAKPGSNRKRKSMRRLHLLQTPPRRPPSPLPHLVTFTPRNFPPKIPLAAKMAVRWKVVGSQYGH